MLLRLCCLSSAKGTLHPPSYVATIFELGLSATQVKCDERPGGCANCERLQLKCPGNDLEQLPSVDELKLPPQAGGKRNKTYRSCGQCRASKTRCSGDRPVCLRCKRKNQNCVYDSDPDPAWARAVFRDSANWGATGAPDEDGTAEDVPSADNDQNQPDVEPSDQSRASVDVRVGVGRDAIDWYDSLQSLYKTTTNT